MYSASPVELGERAEGRQGWGVLGTWISAAFQTPCERQLDPEVDQENEGRGVSHSRWPHQGLSTLPTAHGRLCPGSDLLPRPAAHLALSFYQTGSLHPSLSPDPEPSGGGNWRFPVVEGEEEPGGCMLAPPFLQEMPVGFAGVWPEPHHTSGNLDRLGGGQKSPGACPAGPRPRLGGARVPPRHPVPAAPSSALVGS